MKRVLIVGGSGMLGHRAALEFAAARDLDVHVTVRRPVDPRFRADVTYHEGIDLGSGSGPLGRALTSLEPDVVVNAIGAIKQKDLDEALDQTFFLNGSLPHLLAVLNPNPGARTFHISTDCVFTGTRGGYTEADFPDAEDVYGRSKAVGELDYGRHLTLRTSIVGFEISGHLGLLSWFFSQPPGSTLRGFTRAIYTGLSTGALARLLVALARQDDPPRGLRHVASEPIDKYTLLERINARFGLGHTLMPDSTVRIDRSLDDSRFRADTGTRRPSWDELIADLASDWSRRPYPAVYQALRASLKPMAS